MATEWSLKQPEAQGQLIEALARLDEAIIILDTSLTIVFVSPAFATMFGIPGSVALGAGIVDTLAQVDISNALEELHAALSMKKGWRGLLPILMADGSKAEVLLRISPFGPEEAPTGFVVIAKDMTGERHLEGQLRQTQKLQAIGTLAGGIAHDFNNILSAVLGFAELSAMDAPKGSELAENINEVLIAGRRARDLVKQLLAFSRQSESKIQPFVMKPVVNEALKLLRSSLPTTIDIKRNLASEAAVIGDPVEIHQILMNLCTNGALAMRQKGGVLTVKLQDVEITDGKAASVPCLNPGPYLMLLVGDTGCGMTPELRERIFDPFFTTRMEGEGQGLGLSMVHGIVTGAGGAIEVESQPDEGSVFRVYWPRIKPEDCVGVAEPASLPMGNERVLFVDDEEHQVTLAKKMLGALGYKVTALPSPLDALRIFADAPGRFDLVVTDVTMPGMTGIEFSAELLKIRPEIPIIMCTGYSDLITEEAPARYGARALVAKPVVMREMAETIRQVLDRAKPSA